MAIGLAMINYYEVLGITQDSTTQDIKKSFRRRAKEIHPDLRRDDAGEDMRLLITAYEVLSDIDKRDEYDRALRSLVHVGGFNYREFLRRRRDDPFSQSKLIFHDLLGNMADDAVNLYQSLLREGGFELERYLSREDYMDCAFLLAEVFENRGNFTEAFQLYTKLCRYEREKPYFHHFIDEVIDRLRALLCFKMLPHLQAGEAVARLKEAIRFNFSRKDNAFFYKKLAEVYAESGRQETALHCLRKGLQLDRKLSGVKKLMERIGCPVMP
ncbi:MAG TPA: DnaJ domain-containing protein [Spirochaetia bacterium]|nr:DnaJ domain-containing protein [Spirochaetia bacterium]